MKEKRNGMEVQINGDGPAVKFRIGLWAIIQVIVVLVTFAAAMQVVSADVERLKRSNEELQKHVLLMRETQAKILSTIENLRDEIRYYREKLDKHIERNRR